MLLSHHGLLLGLWPSVAFLTWASGAFLQVVKSGGKSKYISGREGRFVNCCLKERGIFHVLPCLKMLYWKRTFGSTNPLGNESIRVIRRASLLLHGK